MAKGNGIGNFGGGSLSHPRPWRHPQWLGECRAARSRQVRPEEAHELSWGTAWRGIGGVLEGHFGPVLAVLDIAGAA